MSRRTSGPVSTWAEVQRQRQRQQEAQQRAWLQARRETERQQRAAERAASRRSREQQAAYRASREADARQRTDDLERRFAELQGLLAAGCAAPVFTPAALLTPEVVEPFAPGRLAEPIPMPDPNAYTPRQGGGWGAARHERERARTLYENDLRAAQATEALRQRQLADYQRQYRQWADQRLAEIRRQNAEVETSVAALRDGDPEAVEDYLTAALYASAAWPHGLPRQVSASYDRADRQLVLDWELPAFSVVPEASLVRYMPGADRDKEVARPVAERRAAYRDVLAQCLLLVLRELFGADAHDVLDSVVLNGFVDDTDPATGHRTKTVVASALVSDAAFAAVNLDRVNAVDCFTEALDGRLSPRPDKRAAVEPIRLPGEAGRTMVSHGGEEEPDLLAMDPLEFEELVARLFRAMGMNAVTTVRSGDGGVDVDALDPDPIRGGKIVVQVKRYRNTVSPSAVRDLFGTVQSVGANKGVLITTSGFGPTSHAFANGKPLTLVSGPDLVDLLHSNGLGGRLGPAPGTVERTPTLVSTVLPGIDADADADSEASVLGMWWAGGVRLDVCALVCRGGRVLDDDHFVFFNNPRTPDGSVRMMPALGGDKAAIWVSFDRLPARADRVVLVAAVDPDADPDADLTGFTDARIRLTDPSGAEADRLEVSDGRPGETALVLGSFRRSGTGADWRFVAGGKGYAGSGGLVALVGEHGIAVD
ncbi:restriction endonuclease [Streptomyces sp. NPDC088197]|uniref:restriction endonuclease n=1 Tax=Streptomyces sp. NPDC088197 TaxID=3365840 RepID=UPI0037F3B989